MKILRDFICGNDRIEITSNGGNPFPIPDDWGKMLAHCDILVAIPDMHMYLYSARQDGFGCGKDAMLGFLEHLDSINLHCCPKRLRLYS